MKLLTLVAGVFLVRVAGENRVLLNSVMRDLFLNSTDEFCPTCAQKKVALESILGESEIKRYRVEQIKQTILDSLGLHKPPAVEPHQWPQPFKSSSFMEKFHQQNNIYEEIPIEKLILIPQGIRCDLEDLVEMEELSIKMKYLIPGTVILTDITSVKVWLDMAEGKEKVVVDKEPKSFFMELIPCGNQTNEHIITFKGFQSFNGEFIEFDAMPVMKSWLDRGQRCFNISLTMENWSHNYCKKIQMTEHKPFLSIHYKNNGELHQSRLKRSRNCTTRSTECCRENLYVSFEEIGWDEFIISPSGYEAYYCKGTCSPTSSANPHNSVIQSLSAAGKDFTSCCGPSKLSSMELFVSYSNKSAKLVTVPNSVVESCGCL